MTNEGVEVLSRDAIPGHNYLPRGVQELRNFYTNTVRLSNHDDPCIWHPWLRTSCVLGVMPAYALERGDVVRGQG